MTLKQQQKQLHRLFRLFLSLRKKACAIPNINARETSDRDFISLIFCNIPRIENFFDCRADVADFENAMPEPIPDRYLKLYNNHLLYTTNARMAAALIYLALYAQMRGVSFDRYEARYLEIKVTRQPNDFADREIICDCISDAAMNLADLAISGVGSSDIKPCIYNVLRALLVVCLVTDIDLSRHAGWHLKYMTALLNPDLQKLPDF